jgi:hypothetical protein
VAFYLPTAKYGFVLGTIEIIMAIARSMVTFLLVDSNGPFPLDIETQVNYTFFKFKFKLK